jgi:hypothetical protein
MKEIKSVRVRRSNVKSGSLDIKVTLYEDKRTFAADEMILIGTNNGNIVWQEARYKIKNSTDPDFFIHNFIVTNNNLGSTDANTYYSIIQDPWEEKVPIIRDYGYDPYYLNNGAEVYISWTDADSKISEGGEKYSKPDGTEITYDPTLYKETGNVKSLNITKSIRIVHKEETQNLTLNNNNEFEYTIYSKDFRGSDLIVLDILISEWKRKIPNYDLALCSPNNESCSIISYKSPLKPFVPDTIPESVTIVPTNEIPKEPIIVVLPESIKVKIDTTFKIFIGKNKELIETQTVLQDDELTDLSDEYSEEPFAGVEEEELKLQEQISSGQEDSDSQLVEPGTPANIRPFNNLDSLLRLAGDCARELGKNPRVNYGNLRSGYIKGVHGLCPQGTLSVLYALTGIKKVGTIRGNANTFAMNGSNSFTGTGYFNNKLKISKDYFNSPDKWQIGDVVANDYTGGKPYGHIQVWTGFKWVSDFTQNKLQISNVDWNSVALHRLNDKGLDLVKKQSQSIV